ncbi:hypothetical protein CONPUDRAFT_126212, partial [Coniophora puteana RWD-64-598 SS2]
MTTSALPPPSSLGLPEPVYGHPGHVSPTPGSPRSSSPLRNEVRPNRVPPPSAARRNSEESRSGSEDPDGSDNELYDNRPNWARGATSPAVTQFAQNIAQRVGSFMSPTSSNRGLPSDAELEAEALKERERSRREAELILTREADHRRMMEERVFAMMHDSPNSDSFMRPPDRSQTLPNPPSPANSQKEGSPGWWANAKSRLTPTKEKDVTPAQQLIKETKQRDKVKEKEAKKKGKERERDRSPGHLNLSIPQTSSPRTSMSSAGSPVTPSHSPSRPNVAGTGMMTPVNLSPRPSPATANGSPISLRRSPARAGTSPSREAPPLYTSFTSSGTLDVPGTVLLIAKRFEKLERWSVSHVRALEERMGDVERWLVERESEKEKSTGEANGTDKIVSRGRSLSRSPARDSAQLKALREEITELQSRMGEMGREMARLATAPVNLSSTSAARATPVASSAPQTDSNIVSSHGSSFSATAATTGHGATTTVSTNTANSTNAGDVAAHPKSAAAEIGMGFATGASTGNGGFHNNNSTPRRTPSLTARESTSPPLAARMGAPTALGRHSTGTRLPYPTGDYASPENSGIMSPPLGSSPPGSPPPSTRSRTRPVSLISGLPSTTSPLDFGSGHSPVGTPGAPQQQPSVFSQASSTTSIAAVSPLSAPVDRAVSPTGLPVPRQAGRPRTSVSPTPVGGRKRYTVALGGPLTAPDSSDDHDSGDGDGYGDGDRDDDRDADNDAGGQATLGRTAAKRAALVSKMSYPGIGSSVSISASASGTGSNTTSNAGSVGSNGGGGAHIYNNGSTTSVSSTASNGGRAGGSPTSPTRRSPPNRKARAQSVYGSIGDYKTEAPSGGGAGSKVGAGNVGAGAGVGANGNGSKQKLRAQSIDFRTQSLDNLRLDTGEGRFVDPLVLRRQQE